MALTAKQQHFVDEYLIDLNATQAYIRAGYSPNGAQQSSARMLSNAVVQAAIAAGQHAAAERAELSQDYVLSQLQAVADRCMQSAPVLDRNGTETGAWTFQPTPAIRALELLGKHLGMWPNKIIMTDEDREAAQIIADQLGIDMDEVIAETERILKEQNRR